MYVRTPDGVFLESGLGNARLTGAAAYGLIQRLVVRLDGSVTLDELTADLPEPRRVLVTDIVTMLVQRGIARDLDAEPPHHLQDCELDLFREAIAFTEHVTSEAPLHRFETFRDSRVLLIGAGHGMLALIATLLELGLRSATLLQTAEVPADGDAYRRILDRHRRHDPSAELRILDEAVNFADQSLVAEYDAVLHCADRSMPDRALVLTRAARARGVPILHAFPTGEEAWIGPTGGAVGGCWECASLSRRGAHPHGRSPNAGDQPDVGPQWFSTPVGSLIGAALGFAYLRHAVGGKSAPTTMTRVDLRTAVTTEHRVGAHPRCGSCGGHPLDKEAAPPMDVATFAARVPTLVDPMLGPLLSIGVGGYSQISVSCVEATVVDLSGAGTGPATVTAVGASRDQALVRAAAAAVERLVADASGSEWVDPATGEALAAPATVYHGIGFTWAEAQGRAILKLHRDTAVSPARAAVPSPGDPPGAWLDETGWPRPVQVLARELAVMGHGVRAWRDASGIPTVFVGTRDGWLAHSCAPDPDVALEHAMQAAVAALTGRPRDGGEIGPDLGIGDWDNLLPALLIEATPAGSRLLLRRADSFPAVLRVVPFVAAAALLPDFGSDT